MLRPPHVTLDPEDMPGRPGDPNADGLKLEIDQSFLENQVVPIDRLKHFIQVGNIAEVLSDHDLREISSKLWDGIHEDELSQEEWMRNTRKIMKMTMMKNEEKNHPWPHAANIKIPVISTAMLQFSSRMLPDVVKGKDIASYDLIGSDPDGSKERHGKRLSTYLNYQMLRKQKGWYDAHESLYAQLSVIGTCFTKTEYDPVIDEAKTTLVPYDLMVINDYVTSLETAERVGEYYYLSKRRIREFINYGLFRDIPMEALENEVKTEDKTNFEFIQIHTYLDLDGDGYSEPYIVDMHKSSREIFRITCRYRLKDIHYDYKNDKVLCIKALQYYSDTHFIKSPNGRFHSMGFGTFLLNSNKLINSVFNQLIDAGTLANTQTGFIESSIRMRKGDYRMDPGKLINVTSESARGLSDNIFMMQFKEPSQTLFALVQLLMQYVDKFTSVSEAMLGMQDVTNVSPTSLQAMINQGEMVYNSLGRRVLRGQQKELDILIRLNNEHVSPSEYVNVVGIPQYLQVQNPQTGQPQQVPNPEWQEMFRGGQFSEFITDDMNVIPIADMTTSSESKKLAMMNTYLYTIQTLGPNAPAICNLREGMLRVYDAIGMKNPQALINPPPNPQTDPNTINLMSELDMRQKHLQLKDREMTVKEKEQGMKGLEASAKIEKILADAKAVMHDAGLKSVGLSLDAHKAKLDSLNSQIDNIMKIQQTQNAISETDAKVNQLNSTTAQNAMAAQQQSAPIGLPPADLVYKEALRRGYKEKNK